MPMHFHFVIVDKCEVFNYWTASALTKWDPSTVQNELANHVFLGPLRGSFYHTL